jgi:hypothetical protein
MIIRHLVLSFGRDEIEGMAEWEWNGGGGRRSAVPIRSAAPVFKVSGCHDKIIKLIPPNSKPSLPQILSSPPTLCKTHISKVLKLNKM